MYQKTDTGALVRSDGAFIPLDAGNRDYAEYLRWVAEGNSPDPAPVVDWRTPMWVQFRELRDVYLYRLEGIAGRAYRSGDDDFAAALDVFIQGVLDLPAHPTVQPTVATTAVLLSKAINARFSELKNTAVGYDPATATIAFPDRKTIIDKVFK